MGDTPLPAIDVGKLELGLQDSSGLLGDPAALRRRALAEGYLFLRGLLAGEEVLAVRRAMLGALDRFGWLDRRPGAPDGAIDADAVARMGDTFCGAGVTRAAYAAVQKVEAFHAIAHHPRLLALYRALLDGEVFVHPRNIARVMLPGAPGAATTPAHQDHIHVQGTRDAWTCWFPLGDCPIELGGLAVLPRSHREGVIPPRPADGAGGLEVQFCEAPTFLTDSMSAGDVLTFHSLTVHRAVPQQWRDRARLSCDFRYQRVDDPVEARSLQVHCDVLSWDEVYADWAAREDLKYYWRNLPLRLTPWDESLRWQKERICD